jgi:hypothetical protein
LSRREPPATWPKPITCPQDMWSNGLSSPPLHKQTKLNCLVFFVSSRREPPATWLKPITCPQDMRSNGLSSPPLQF